MIETATISELTMTAAEGGEAGPDAEAALVDRARTDRRAFGCLFRLHYAAIVGYLYRRTGDEHAAEDLAAETFMAALGAIAAYTPRGVKFRTWLYRIATNAANRWWRRRKRQPATTHDGRLPEPAADSPTASPDIAEARAALLALSPKFQSVLSLHYLESLEVEEVAAVLRCRAGTVKSRLARAREALRAEIERRDQRHA